MNAQILPGRPAGTAAVPPSKSAANRTVLCAGLASGTSRIENIDFSADIRAMLDAVKQLGAKVTEEEHALTIRGCGGNFATVTHPVYCNESGTALRFLIPVFSLTAQRVRFQGAGRLFQRPQYVYQGIFGGQGVRFEQKENEILVFGQLRGGEFTLPGDVSSQFISGLLFAAPLMTGDSVIRVKPPFESRSYVDMTLDAMRKFGVKARVATARDGTVSYFVAGDQGYAAADVAIEADYSQAAFPAVLGTLVGEITLTGLAAESRQGDRVILDILKACGGRFKSGGGSCTFQRSLLRAARIDLADCPDLGPILMVLGCFCSGATVIDNARRLRLKESDRIAAMEEELRKFGAVIESDENTVTITGTALHAPETPLCGHNDHRVVMSLAVAALAAGVPAVITGAQAVRKSWPGFFDMLQTLNAKVVLEDG